MLRRARDWPPLDRIGKVLLTLGFGLLIVSWAMTAPAGGFPDELDHYVRALSVARGELEGDPDPTLTPEVEADATPKSCCDIGNGTSQAWVLRGSRIVDIPARMAPEHLDCEDVAAWDPGRCSQPAPERGTIARQTLMGTIEPVPYVAPGLATHLTSDPDLALRLARLTNAILSTTLLAVAVWALWPRRGVGSAPAITGLLVATSPMVLFIAASPSPSATEVTAGIAFCALLLRLTRPGAGHRRLWVALGVVGAVLATSRSLGPVWILLEGLAVLALSGPRVIWDRVRGGGWWALGAIVAVTAAAASTVAWEAAVQPGVPFDRDFFLDQLGPATEHLRVTSQELVGVFGGLDIVMGAPAYAAWAVAAAVLSGLALAAGRWRDRLLLVISGAGAASVVVLVSAAILRQNGFNLQARHILAVVVTVPLLAGEIAQRGAHRLPSWTQVSSLLVVVIATVAVHVSGLLASARRYDLIGTRPNGPGGTELTWSPPGGAGPWLAVVGLGAAALVTGALVAATRASAAPERLADEAP